MCDCISEGPGVTKKERQKQRTPPVRVIYPPTGLAVSIDACIVETMCALWEGGIRTASCCCTHNEYPGPSCILSDPKAGDSEFHEAAKIILESGDKREWQFLSAPNRPPYSKEIDHLEC